MAASLVVLTATAERLHLQLSNPDGFNVGTLMRTDVNGTRTVRNVAGQLPSTAALLDFYDYEYALSGTVTYVVYTGAGNAIAQVTYTAASVHDLVIACPLYPSAGVVLSPDDTGDTLSSVSFALSWNSTRAALSTLHQVIGRSEPVPVLRPAATRAGDLTLICPDHATCEQIEAALALPQLFMLRQSDVPGLDCYFVVRALAASNIEGIRRWQLVVSLTELDWPAGEFVPPGVWTYADVLAAYGDYNAVAASFATYADLLDRTPKP